MWSRLGSREAPPPYTGIVHEAALRTGFGGPAVAREQLGHLLDMSELAHVTIRVVPCGAEHFPTTGRSFDYVEGPVPQLDTVQVPGRSGPHGVVRAHPVETETATTPTAVHIRDSTHPAGPRLTLGPAAWAGFLPYVARSECPAADCMTSSR
ncbi:Scr1 family TA system antitoxin-like transcriptional regulator [Streptomyces sp. NPDC049590]|uniref:DUF397 domain-containing protein n=1 Tax=Streptomyces sp. NPDC049590 TaxID=3154834 RepID=UPI00342693B4